MNTLLVLIGLVLAGFFSGRLPMSSKVALGLSLVPAAGFGLMPVFC